MKFDYEISKLDTDDIIRNLDPISFLLLVTLLRIWLGICTFIISDVNFVIQRTYKSLRYLPVTN